MVLVLLVSPFASIKCLRCTFWGSNVGCRMYKKTCIVLWYQLVFLQDLGVFAVLAFSFLMLFPTLQHIAFNISICSEHMIIQQWQLTHFVAHLSCCDRSIFAFEQLLLLPSPMMMMHTLKICMDIKYESIFGYSSYFYSFTSNQFCIYCKIDVMSWQATNWGFTYSINFR